jgi:hypothetical protein
MFHAGGRVADHSYALIGLAGLLLALHRAGEPVAAGTLYGFVSRRLNVRSLPVPMLQGIDELQQQLGPAVFTRTASIGAAMTQPEIERYAVAQIDDALAKLADGGTR